MKPLKKHLLTVTVSFLLAITANTAHAEAIGYYSNGSLKNAIDIRRSNATVHKLFVSREKFFGTDELVRFIEKLTNRYKRFETLQVGDLSAQEGGLAKGHKSHQNGLDFDAVYFSRNKHKQGSDEKYWEEYFVINGKVSANFHLERNWDAMKYMASQEEVGRIFVDVKIKKAFCEHAKNKGEFAANTEVLRKIRVVNLHKTHFHVRLKCPRDDDQCTNQVAPPAGSGCDKV